MLDYWYADSYCSRSEMYVRWMENINPGGVDLSSSFRVWDSEVRDTDFHTFYVGTYTYANGMNCFLAKVDTDGSLLNGARMEEVNTWVSGSECWNIALMPNLPYVVFVGTLTTERQSGNYKSAMITKAKDDFTNSITMIWST